MGDSRENPALRRAIIDALQCGTPDWSPGTTAAHDAEDTADAILYVLRDRGLLA